MQSAFHRWLCRPMKTIAYLTSLYARASDSFIRAEVRQLRSFGHTVHTFSIQEPDASEQISDDIRDERAHTDYILKHGFLRLLMCVIIEFLRAPLNALSALALATKCGWPGIKGRLWPYAYFLEACYLSGQLRKKHIDHLHNHIGEGSAVVAMLASSLSAVPYSLTIHGPSEFDQPTLLALGGKIHRSRFTIAISEYGRSQLFRWADHADWNKIHVVRCGVDWESIKISPPSTERRLVCVGRLSEPKGHLILVEAIARLKAEPFFEILVVGDGPLRGKIEAKADALGIRDRIKILGWMKAEKVLEQISQCRAMVLPSFAEGLPVVLMESLALERPVIASGIAGIPELVENNISGWLVPAGSVDALAGAMREALLMDPTRLAQMGHKGSTRVRELHDQVKEARKLEALIEN